MPFDCESLLLPFDGVVAFLISRISFSPARVTPPEDNRAASAACRLALDGVRLFGFPVDLSPLLLLVDPRARGTFFGVLVLTSACSGLPTTVPMPAPPYSELTVIFAAELLSVLLSSLFGELRILGPVITRTSGYSELDSIDEISLAEF